MELPPPDDSTFVEAIRRDGAAFVRRGACGRASTRRCRRARRGRSAICSAHVGRLHRWAAEIVAARPADRRDHWWTTRLPPTVRALVDLVRRRVRRCSPTRSPAPDPTQPCWSWTDRRTSRILGAAPGPRARRAPLGRAARGRHDRSRSSTRLAVDGIQELFDSSRSAPAARPTRQRRDDPPALHRRRRRVARPARARRRRVVTRAREGRRRGTRHGVRSAVVAVRAASAVDAARSVRRRVAARTLERREALRRRQLRRLTVTARRRCATRR